MANNFSKSNPVVVVGGGFGGLTAALELSYSKNRPTIILIEPRPRFVFLPFLYELLSGELQLWEVAPTYKSLLSDRGIVVIKDSVVSVECEAQTVLTASGLTIHYSQLLLGTGSESKDCGIQGVKEHALRFQNLADVDLLRDRIKALNESKGAQKSFVIIGAGATGVELACKLSDLLDSDTHLHLIEVGDRILPQGKSFNQEQAQLALNRRGIRLHLRTRVLSVLEGSVELSSSVKDSGAPFSLMNNGLVWAAGTSPSIPLGLFELSPTGKRLPVDEHLQVIGLKNVFAIGDVACHVKNPAPSTAQVAIQQGQMVAKNLMAIRNGHLPDLFEFLDLGEMLSLGVGEATITGLGLTLAGPMAFYIRRIIYVTRMPGLSLGVRSAGAWILSS